MADVQTGAGLAPLSLNRVAEGLQRVLIALTTEPWVKPLSVALGTRVAIYTLVYFFVGLFPVGPESKPGFWKALSRWDAGWYFRIAQEGYVWKGPDTQSAVVFWPLYPALSKAAGWLFGDLHWGFLIVTTVSMILFLYYLYRLALLDFSPSVAERAIVYAAVFPGAFVLAAFYSEATAFALTIATFYYARLGRWRLAIALAFLTGLTRITGLAILFPLVYEWWRQRGSSRQALWLGIIPLGALGFGLYVWYLSGNPFTIVTLEQTAWSHGMIAPWDELRIALERAFLPLKYPETSVNLLDAGSMLLFIGLTIWALARMPRAYWLYAFPVLMVSLSQGTDPNRAQPTASMTRYLMAIFPGYIALAQIARHPILDQAVRWTFVVLMAVFSIWFFVRFWVL